MKHRVVQKNGRCRRKPVLEWHEKFAFVVIILADAYVLAQLIRFVVVR